MALHINRKAPVLVLSVAYLCIIVRCSLVMQSRLLEETGTYRRSGNVRVRNVCAFNFCCVATGEKIFNGENFSIYSMSKHRCMPIILLYKWYLYHATLNRLVLALYPGHSLIKTAWVRG